MSELENSPKDWAKRKAEPKRQGAKRAERFAEAQDKRGLVRWQPWVTPDERELLAAYLAQLRQRAGRGVRVKQTVSAVGAPGEPR